jgi:hypothetical protein
MDKAAGDNWASIAILAHEIGHHLNGHTLLGSGSQPPLELEADEFSGFVLRKMGASLSQAQSAMKIAADTRASRTHPAQQDRLTAIAEGWNKAGNQQNGKPELASVQKQQPAPQQRIQEPVQRVGLNERFIAFDVRFHADRNTPYYITTEGNLVTLKNDQLLIIGKAQRTGNESFPFKITDDKTALYVARDGMIVTSTGRQVGLMANHA